jgi:hypothetical protein
MEKTEIAPAYSPLWKKLYSLIKEFVREKPWVLFENEDVFIVQSPRDNQMYLCCVMGNGGEEFGLNAFRGAQGMRNFDKMVTHRENSGTDRNLMFELDMLSFSLSPRDFMEKNDLAVTKKLMLSFSGGTWPLIRSYKPLYYPWYLSEPEIEALCVCMEQTLALYNAGEKALNAIRNVVPGEILVQCMENAKWISRKLSIGYPAREETPEIHLDDITIRRLINLPDTGLKEEIDLVHFPGAIKDHEPPYYGLFLLGIDERQFAYQYGLFPPFIDYFQAACDKLAQGFLSRGSKPCMVFLKNESPFADVFEKIAKQAGIKCKKNKDLPYISDFLNSMDQGMKGSGFP